MCSYFAVGISQQQQIIFEYKKSLLLNSNTFISINDNKFDLMDIRVYIEVECGSPFGHN